MAFKGQTYRLAFSEGGLNGGDNYDLIPESSMTAPSRNIDMHNGLREKRGGSTKDNSVAITAGPKCLGIGQYVPSSGTADILSGHSDGKLWKNQTTALKTGMSQTNRYNFVQAGDIVVACDGATTPQVYTGGSSTADITTSAADWTGSNQPSFMVLHSRGASRRLVAFGAGGNLNSWYMSPSGSYQDFSSGSVLKFTGDFGDSFGATAAIDFNAEMLIFGKQRTLILNDNDTSTANWGWQRAPWSGGAAHQKLVVKADNDVYAMMEDGDIYSIRTVAQINDYKKASVTRPAFIHRYIENFVDLSKIAEFHCSYDAHRRAIMWWVVRTGQLTADTALVFYLDRPVDQAWAVEDGIDNTASGLRATASCVVRKSDGTYSIKTGDANGFIWSINLINTFSDDGNGYAQVIRTPWLAFKNPRNQKRFIRAEVHFIVSGAYPVSFRWFVDDAEQAGIGTTVGGSGNVFPLTFGTSSFGAAGMDEVQIDLGQVGRRIMFELSNSNAGQNVRFADLLIDFVDRGAGYL